MRKRPRGPGVPGRSYDPPPARSGVRRRSAGPEPETSRTHLDAVTAPADGTTRPGVEQGLIALGFDAAFARTHLARRSRAVRAEGTTHH